MLNDKIKEKKKKEWKWKNKKRGKWKKNERDPSELKPNFMS